MNNNATLNLTSRISRICLIGLSLTVLAALTAVAQAKPNVVLIYADDFGWGDLRHHNDRPEHFRYTPNLDVMFGEGVELTNYMTHPVCSPSRAGLLTGKHYAKVAAGPRTGGTLPNDIRNIAKDFQAAGYRTGAFGKWHNSYPNFPADGNGRIANYNKEGKFNELHGQKTLDLTDNIFGNHKGWKWGVGVNAYGFDRWVGYYNGGGDLFNRYVDIHHDIDWWHDRSYRSDEKGYTTDLITKYALEFIEQSKGEPFFCYIPHLAIHNPLQLKRSDLMEFCSHLDSKLGIKGQWDYISKIVSPKTGRKVGEVEEIRFGKNEEFDLAKLDRNKGHLTHLANAAFIYTLDKSVGMVFRKIADLGLGKNTIFVFASDNGGTPRSVNLPFQGGKHTLWEGGVHVPAAIWWPGTFDRKNTPYARRQGGSYEGLIGYIDLYPTLMAMTRQQCQAKDLDGMNCWQHLQNGTECRPDELSDAFFWMWDNFGTIRTRKWKLFYSETSRPRLYDIQSDVAEKNNVAASHPEVCKILIEQYRNWINDNNYSMSWMAIEDKNLSHTEPAPEGDILEIRAIQNKPIKNQKRDGTYIRFATGSGWEEEYDAYVHAGDRVEFDIFVREDSDAVTGCYYTPGSGWNPYFNESNGINQDGELINNLELPKGKWVRQVVGVGNLCPAVIKVNYIALLGKNPGTYHYYLDNIVIRKSDDGIRSVIWQSKPDLINLIYRYGNKNYNTLEKAKESKGFAFSDIELSVTSHSRE
ncbi:MAG: sulfatase-like hydrolase/transferase [Verrucomicrobiota bacterium]